MRVDLPAPFSPTSAWISPAWTVRLTLLSAWTPGNVLVIPRISRTAVMAKPQIESPARGRAGPIPFWRLLDLVFLVVAAVHQDLLPVGRVDAQRLQQVGRHRLDAVLVGLGVVHLD